MPANRFVQGAQSLLRAMRDLEKTAKPGQNYYIELWPDGSGHITVGNRTGVRNIVRDPLQQTVFSFQTPAELWAWLHADPKTRREMAALGRWREKREEQQQSPDEIERALRAAAKPETLQ